jgi:hypothetical protein
MRAALSRRRLGKGGATMPAGEKPEDIHGPPPQSRQVRVQGKPVYCAVGTTVENEQSNVGGLLNIPGTNQPTKTHHLLCDLRESEE